MSNQKVTIRQEKLKELLVIKGLTFELLFTYDTPPAYYGLVGRPCRKYVVVYYTVQGL